MDEADIHQLLADGRPREAFERLVVRFQKKVFHLALSMSHNEATAQDLAQDVFLRVWKALPVYDGRASLSTWIYTISRNVCLNELQRAARKNTVPLDAPELVRTVETLTALDSAEASVGASQDIEAVLARLAVKYQQVLRLFYLEQKSYEETAALLGLPMGTVKTFLFRARKELARLATERECGGTSTQQIEQP